MSYVKTFNCSGCDKCPNREYANAGGYGFWCNKECAKRRDEKREYKRQKEEEKSSETSALLDAVNTLSMPTTSSGNTLLYVGIGVGFIALAGVLYFTFRKK